MPKILIKAGDEGALGWLNELPEIGWEDLAETVRLDGIAAANGGHTPWKVLADEPVAVGGTQLYMPTLGALEWLQSVLPELPDDRWSALASAYACHSARQPKELWGLNDSAAVQGRVRQWLRGIGATEEELLCATKAAMEGFPLTGPLARGDSTDTLTRAAAHMREFGATLDYWLWSQPAQRVLWIGRGLENDATPQGRLRPGMKAAFTAMAALRRRCRAKYLDAAATEADTDG